MRENFRPAEDVPGPPPHARAGGGAHTPRGDEDAFARLLVRGQPRPRVPSAGCGRGLHRGQSLPRQGRRAGLLHQPGQVLRDQEGGGDEGTPGEDAPAAGAEVQR